MLFSFSESGYRLNHKSLTSCLCLSIKAGVDCWLASVDAKAIHKAILVATIDSQWRSNPESGSNRVADEDEGSV